MRKLAFFGSLVLLSFATFLAVKTVAQFCEPTSFVSHGGVKGWSDAFTQSIDFSIPSDLIAEASIFDAKSSVTVACPGSGRLCNVCYRVEVYIKNNFNQWVQVTYPTISYNSSSGPIGTFGVACGQSTNSDNNTIHVENLTPGMTYMVIVRYGAPNGESCDYLYNHTVEFNTPQYADGPHEVPLS